MGLVKGFKFPEIKATSDGVYTDEMIKQLAGHIKDIQPKEVDDGIFISHGFNLEPWLKPYIVERGIWGLYSWCSDGGWCDNHKQLTDYYSFERDERRLIIVMYPRCGNFLTWNREYGAYHGAFEHDQEKPEFVYEFRIYELKDTIIDWIA